MTARSELIMSLLGKGKENAVNREALAEALGLEDRATRQAVSYARLEGCCICNDQDGEGYYIGTDRAELERQYKQTVSRGKMIFASLAALRREMGKDENQLSIFNDLVSEE